MRLTKVGVDDLPMLEAAVLVVGAGPTGLMAGVVCAARGVTAVVVDQKVGPTRESRALAVQARTMEIYDQLGIVDKVIAGANNAVKLQIGDEPGAEGFNIARLQERATRFPGIQMFEQSRNEQLLYDTLKGLGGDVRWNHRLLDLETIAEPDGGVVALLEGEESLLRVKARWCIGADGASSAVRRDLDLRFDGVTDESTFWVADIRDLRGLDDGTATVRFGKALFGMIFPIGPGGHVRLIALAPHPAVTEEEALQAARDDLGLRFGQVDWFSTYRVHHRVASRFRVGSVFLAGDAAHVHSPVGGQGMNTGLQDAHNLALLLADVSQGRIDPSALDRYENERRPVAKLLVKVTDRAFGVVARSGSATSLLRGAGSGIAALIMPRVAGTRLGPRLGGYLGQYRIRYHFLAKHAPAQGWADDRAVGLRLPPVENNNEPLRAMTWQIHTYGSATLDRPDLPDWIDGPHAFPSDPYRRLRSDRMYLVRPDGFVAASIRIVGRVADETQLRSAIATHHLLTETSDGDIS
jgi:2-polyprenyl-6-methoxyphenol hydroxylase-like FAD-dependent oxidoreductase